MKQAMSIAEVATQLGLTAEVTRALVALVFGAERDVLSVKDLGTVREAQARVARVQQTPPHAPTFNERGQAVMDFGRPPRGAPWLRPVAALEDRRDADELFARAVRLEEQDASQALAVYAEALGANPHHADAHVNVGRLLHQRGQLREAEAHYVAALVARPTDSTATFNLAVVLDDLGRHDDAIARYREAIELDPGCVDAYFNLSRLYEKKGEKVSALRHLKDYRRLIGRQ
jgi:tetratricopeptide (TPR) repeat protein